MAFIKWNLSDTSWLLWDFCLNQQNKQITATSAFSISELIFLFATHLIHLTLDQNDISFIICITSSSSHFNFSPEETLFHLFPLLENCELLRLISLSDPNVDVVFVSPVELLVDVMVYLKKLLVAGAAQQSSLRSAPSSSSSSSTGAACRSTSLFRRRRSEEKKAAGDDQPSSSSAPAIDPSNASAVAASYTSVGAMDDIERRLRIVVPEAAEVYVLQTLRGICCGVT